MQAKPDSGNPRKASDVVELILFRLGDEEFSAAIDQVREVITKGPIAPIPNSPSFIRGVANVRGEVTLIVDLRAYFGMPVAPEVQSRHIVITRQEHGLFGLMVDEVTAVLRTARSEIKAAPESLAKVENDHTKGVLTLESRLVILLDLVELLSDENFAALAEVPAVERTPVDHTRKKKDGPSRLPGDAPGNESESLQAVGAATAGGDSGGRMAGDKPA
jgi:purine-binding chemotaxis protein CheW